MSGRHRRGDADDTLIDQVGALFERLDPMPAGGYTAALEAVLLRSPAGGEEALRIAGDSAVDELLVGARGERSVGLRRVLECADAVGAVTVHLELSTGEGVHRLCGTIEATTIPAVVVLRTTGIVRESSVDGSGRFRFDDLPDGPLRVELDQSLGRRIVTPWFVG